MHPNGTAQPFPFDPGDLGRKVGALVDHLRAEPDRVLGLPEVAAVTEVLIASLHRYTGSIDIALYRECQALREHIIQARSEISDIRPKDITERRIPRAGQELAAIVQATEEATSAIMGAAEEMMNADPDTLKGVVDNACMRIFEACAFQDITGQRIAKVVGTLDFIEKRLTALCSTSLGGDQHDAAGDENEDNDPLLNGPALEGEGIDQNAVDGLLAAEAAPLAPTAEPPAPVKIPAPAKTKEFEAAKPAAVEPKVKLVEPAPPKAVEPAGDAQSRIDAMFA
ncbi:MAG: protein phosphatase CheZ [Alphaproteobacteria bacterium]